MTARRSAYPMLLRCAAHQLREDVSLYQHLLEQKRAEQLLRPNLLLNSAPVATHHGTLVPVLMVKAG
jgi:hypothetical protein